MVYSKVGAEYHYVFQWSLVVVEVLLPRSPCCETARHVYIRYNYTYTHVHIFHKYTFGMV